MRTIGVLGGGLAGVSAVRALRTEGFAGRVVVVADEPGAPYDRPPLSKAFLGGSAPDPEALLGVDEQLDAEWRDTVGAVALHASRRAVELSDGSELELDGVIVATGARARQPWADPPAGVHVLRTAGDARALRAELVPGARLAVVGAGFIGAEVASTARSLGLDVTVLEADPAPLRAALGPDAARTLTGLHARHGVRLLTGVPVAGFRAAGIGAARRVTGVQLADGRIADADVVVVGVGVAPNVEWLAGSGLALHRGVRCDAYGGTDLPSVVAVGDCATWHEPAMSGPHRVEHWTAARERAPIAVRTLLSAGTVRSVGRPAYFWSDQYGLRLQVAGHPHLADELTVEAGSFAEADVLAVYRLAGAPIAVLALGRAKEFMRRRKQLAAAAASPARMG